MTDIEKFVGWLAEWEYWFRPGLMTGKRLAVHPSKSADALYEGVQVIRPMLDQLSVSKRTRFWTFLEICYPYKPAYDPQRALKLLPDVRAAVRSLKNQTAVKSVSTTVDGEWSRPMTKTDMRVRLSNMTVRKFNSFTKNHPVRSAGGRQLWQICRDGMDKATKSALSRS